MFDSSIRFIYNASTVLLISELTECYRQVILCRLDMINFRLVFYLGRRAQLPSFRKQYSGWIASALIPLSTSNWRWFTIRISTSIKLFFQFISGFDHNRSANADNRGNIFPSIVLLSTFGNIIYVINRNGYASILLSA